MLMAGACSFFPLSRMDRKAELSEGNPSDLPWVLGGVEEREGVQVMTVAGKG